MMVELIPRPCIISHCRSVFLAVIFVLLAWKVMVLCDKGWGEGRHQEKILASEKIDLKTSSSVSKPVLRGQEGWEIKTQRRQRKCPLSLSVRKHIRPKEMIFKWSIENDAFCCNKCYWEHGQSSSLGYFQIFSILNISVYWMFLGLGFFFTL